MAENVLYADLNFPESTRPKNLTVPDVQGSGCTYAEVKVKSQDTNAAANCKSSSKSCCSRKHVAILVVIILLLVLALYLIITYGPAAGRQQDSTILTSTGQNGSTPLSSTCPEDSTELPPSSEEASGCPPAWKKHGRKCYFFSTEKKRKDWESCREECAAMGSDLVVIDSRDELKYLCSQSKYEYYLLGLRYSLTEKKWKWINNVEHDPAMFNIIRPYSDYHCMVIGFRDVGTAPCGGSPTTQNMCEKDATMSKRHQKES